MQNTILCPVCYGRGTVQSGFYNHGVAGTSAALHEMCKSCGGAGVIKNEQIKIENKIDVSELAKVLQEQARGTACEILSLMKAEYHRLEPDHDWRINPIVQQIANFYCINLNEIR